jgi:hypothetical protein
MCFVKTAVEKVTLSILLTQPLQVGKRGEYKMIDLLNISNEEIIELFRKEIFEAEPDPEWKRRCEEYRQNIERDLQEEWAKKHFKWFFTKHRKKKLKYKISLRYTSPVFWLIEDIIEDTLPQAWSSDEYFNKFVDVKDVASDDKVYFKENTKWLRLI